jgi:tRNA (cmo5U34)-methyltransferase
MRKAVFDVGSRFARTGTSIIDLGCSRGDALVPFVMQLGSTHKFVGIEVSPTLVAGARERFRDEIEQGWVEIRELDLRTTYPHEPASVTLAILSLQFLPIECRQQVLFDAYENTVDGGALIIVERIMGTSAELDLLFAAEYHKSMTAYGYPAEEVERKRLMLEGVLVPLTAPWNEEMIVDAGFTEIDCFWRWMNFCGWVARKPPGGRYARAV